MREFYQQLSTASIKTEALRQTQLSMLKEKIKVNSSNEKSLQNKAGIRVRIVPNAPRLPELTHPYYWAGFTLIGNPWQ